MNASTKFVVMERRVPSNKTDINENIYNSLPTKRLGTLVKGKDPAVIIFNGTFCPIHAGHLNALNEATKYVNSLEKYQIVAGYVSPCHSSYALSKLSGNVISTRHRLNMVHRALELTDNWMVDLFESYAERHIEIYAILRHFLGRVSHQLSPHFGGKKIAVFWLYGSDGICVPPNKLMDEGLHVLCVSNRGGDAKIKFDNLIRNFKNLSKRLHFVECTNMDISSTAIRKACQIEDSTARLTACQKLVGIDSVVSYMMEHRLWCSAEQLMRINTSEIDSPFRLADITPEFLTKVFHEKNVLSVNDSVLSFEKRLIGLKQGYSGVIYRLFDIKYALTDDADQQMTGVKYKPSSVIAKFASGISKQWIETEISFYREVAPILLKPHVPFCYYTSILGNGSRNFILMEDLSWATTYSFDEGLPRDLILKVVDYMAEFHAEFWSSPKLSNLYWLPQSNDSGLVNYLFSRFKLLWTRAKKELTRVLPKESIKLGDLLYKKGEILLKNVCLELPQTYCHGDLWIYNIMFGTRPSNSTLFEDPSDSQDTTVAVIDWQTGFMGNGLIDIAFLLYISADTEEIDSLEETVLNRYYEQLQRFGVTKLTRDRFDEMYERALIYAFIKNFLGVSDYMLVDSTNEPCMSVKWQRILKNLARLQKVDIRKYI